jgi:hypothetical protein
MGVWPFTWKPANRRDERCFRQKAVGSCIMGSSESEIRGRRQPYCFS